MAVKVILFFPDYEAGPLWDKDGGGIALCDDDSPDDLPLTIGLQLALRAWAKEVGFPMEYAEHPEVLDRFRREGRDLRARVAAELGPAYEVKWEADDYL